MERKDVLCRFFTPTAGCTNHEKAGPNAGETMIVGQPWSCILANKVGLQKGCPGFALTPQNLKDPNASPFTDEDVKKAVDRIGQTN